MNFFYLKRLLLSEKQLSMGISLEDLQRDDARELMIRDCAARGSAHHPTYSTRLNPNHLSLMVAVARLRPNHQEWNLGLCAMLLSANSSVSIHFILKQHAIQSGCINDEPWMIKGQINFPMILLLGHLLMSYDEADLVVPWRSLKPAY